MKPTANNKDMKTIFLTAVVIAVPVIIAVFVLILVLPGLSVWLELEKPERIAFFSLFVDAVIGIFTIGSLYWAATQFAESAIKPHLQLLPAKGKRTSSSSFDSRKSFEEFYPPMRNSPFRIQGRRIIHHGGGITSPVPHIVCGLFLRNEASRAGRYVTMKIRFEATPTPDVCTFHHRSSRPEVSPITINGEEISNSNSNAFSMTIQFSEHLVVYQAPVLVGVLEARWCTDLTDDCFPTDVIIHCDIFYLDGASHDRMQLLIDWERE